MANSKVVVIGGGPAGMMAASVAARHGNTVILIEKNNSLGKKLLITGKGRCNITNNADISEFIENTPVNSNFLYSAFYTFTNTQLIALLNKLGVETKVERGERVFPVSDRAKDVLSALKKFMSISGVKVYNGEASDILVEPDGKKKVVLSDRKFVTCDKVIIATGGLSYPNTGSTGDGYRFAKKLGHTIVPVKPSLVPMVLVEKEASALQGLSLKNVSLTVYKNGKKMYDDFGEMLFTHYGVSGPIVLSASSHIRDLSDAEYKISVDLKPALDFETLDKRVLRDFEEFKNKDFINSLDKLLPQKLIPVIAKLSGIDERKKTNEITREERHKFVELLKDLRFTVKEFRPIDEAIISSGGIEVKEINPSTMESKIVPGVYFAGEVIDVDAYTGGFNLQIAFSTGYLAGANV